MVIIKVLKRKDASSVVVAIIVALIVLTLIGSLTNELANEISGTKTAFEQTSFDATYLQPTVSAILQLAALEVLSWIYLLVAAVVGNLPVSVAPKRKK